ncbi:type II toxin-antitoxin system Phd/YefM family antitoxin [Aestuariivirga sp.]
MTRLSITEIKARWLEIMARVEAGETIVVTRHGKPVADLHPHRPADR